MLLGKKHGCRKDIERAFGVLQGKFQVLARPLMGHDLQQLSDIVSCCIILHNMCVSDRVMGDCRVLYKPCNLMDDAGETVDYPEDFATVSGAAEQGAASIIGVNNATLQLQNIVQGILQRSIDWHSLANEAEHRRLQQAAMKVKANYKSNN